MCVVYDVYVYSFRTTNGELMLSALVPFQMTRLTKSFIAHITFVRFLVRVNTHVLFKVQLDVKLFSHTSHSYGFSFV